MSLSAIVAATPDGTIGLNGDMPWRLSSDLRRFKRLTMGHIMLMGRKTFDSIGKPLPGRRTFVLTRDASWRCEGVEVFHDRESVMSAVGNDQAFVVGGAQIYTQWLPACQHLFLTRVWSQTPGDTFVDLRLADWECKQIERVPAGPKDSIPTEFCVFERRKSAL